MFQFCEQFRQCFAATTESAVVTKQRTLLRLVEQAKTEWQFSVKLLTEQTDPDLIDYGVYLIKSNEAKYRYLLKLARQEHITSEM